MIPRFLPRNSQLHQFPLSVKCQPGILVVVMMILLDTFTENHGLACWCLCWPCFRSCYASGSDFSGFSGTWSVGAMRCLYSPSPSFVCHIRPPGAVRTGDSTASWSIRGCPKKIRAAFSMSAKELGKGVFPMRQQRCVGGEARSQIPRFGSLGKFGMRLEHRLRSRS